MYSARFIELLNELATPGFHTLELFDGAVNAVVGALYSITEDEAGCLGIFFEKIWSLISGWRYDKSKYDSTLSEKVSYFFLQCIDRVMLLPFSFIDVSLIVSL